METEEIVQRIDDNCKLLWKGYEERVEYSMPVTYHVGTCFYYSKSTLPKECDCPVTHEKRARNVNRPGLLEQLKEFAANKDTDRNAKAERGAPRVKVAGKPPGDMAGFFALDEIMCDIYSTLDRVLEEAGRDRNWASSPVKQMLITLHNVVGGFADTRPDLARQIDKAVAGWVARARAALKINAGEAMFDGVLCGNCGVGALATPWGNTGDHDVRCVGTPEAPPCGHSYPMSEWISLYEGRRK